MSGWPEKERKRHEDLLRGQGKHEALLLQCRLREHRHPFTESLEMKYIDREKKKIEDELIKIRHTIHHERRNPRALSLSTRSLTMEAIAPSRRHSFSVKTNPINLGFGPIPGRTLNTRLSLDPALLETTGKSLSGKRPVVGHVQRDDKPVNSELTEINEETREQPRINEAVAKEGDVVDAKADNPTTAWRIEAVPNYDRAEVTPVIVAGPDVAADPKVTTAPDVAADPHVSAVADIAAVPNVTTVSSTVQPGVGLGLKEMSQVHLNIPVPRLCRRNPTFVQGRQPSFINRSNTYIKKRRELNNSTDILSCANYKEMRQGIAKETLKKFGLL